MPRSATGHRHRRWSLRHPGQPHQPPRSWPYDQSCTNIQPGPPSGRRPSWFIAGLTFSILFSSNIIGVAFTGLEHSAHVLVTLIVVLGLIRALEEKMTPWWLA